MCTLTYLPQHAGYFLTTNRDENTNRAIAIAPKKYSLQHVNLFFPRDGAAGGTWIVAKENKDALCLLNGAFQNFEPKENYNFSRGLVLLQIAREDDMIACFNKLNYGNVAPFTVIIVQGFSLFECRWDGGHKHFKQLDAATPHIWSSATLYNDTLQSERKTWFNSWLSQEKILNRNSILQFHKTAGGHDKRNSLVMNRDNQLCTVSITSIHICNEDSSITYVDLKNNQTSIVPIYEKQLAV
jgi:hypothetical protein